MGELSAMLGGGLGTTAGLFVAAVLALAFMLPKLLNGFKGDQLDSNILSRVKAMEDHALVQDRKMILQDDKIHRYAVKVTKLIVVIIRLEALLIANSVNIPEELVGEIARMKDETEREDK